MDFHSIRDLHRHADGDGPGAQQARLRLLWFERGRTDAMQGKSMRPCVNKMGRIIREAYLDGYTMETRPSEKSRAPRPLRANSAEVRAA